jgi:hypothetical protein
LHGKAQKIFFNQPDCGESSMIQYKVLSSKVKGFSQIFKKNILTNLIAGNQYDTIKGFAL